MSATTILCAVAVVCLLVAAWQARRAESHITLLLARDADHARRRTELVQVFLDEQQRQERRHEGERGQWRDERAELLNAVLAGREDRPVTVAPGWGNAQPDRLYRTEDDEIAEARARVAAQIQEQIDIRQPLAPGADGDVAA